MTDQFAVAIAGLYLGLTCVGAALYWLHYWFVQTPEQREADRAYHASDEGWWDRQL